jgi:hypothetical protein
MTITKTKETYKVQNDKCSITMVIDFRYKNVTLENIAGRKEFHFIESDPDTAFSVVECMREAISKAKELLNEQPQP